MSRYVIALMVTGFFLLPSIPAMAQGETYEKPTVKQVFEYVRIIDDNFPTDPQEAYTTLDLWMDGTLQQKKGEPLDKTTKKIFTARANSCTECIFRCCPFFQCQSSCVMRCLDDGPCR